MSGVERVSGRPEIICGTIETLRVEEWKSWCSGRTKWKTRFTICGFKSLPLIKSQCGGRPKWKAQ